MTKKSDEKMPKPLEPKKKPDGNFEIDNNGMVVFDTPGPTEKPQGTVTHRR